MKKFSRSKIVFCLAAIFLVGAVTGATTALGFAKAKVEKDLRMQNLETSIMNWAKSRLDLTPEQVERIEPLVELACNEYRAEFSQTIQRVIEIIRASNQRVAKELTPAQAEKLFAAERKHEANLRRLMENPPPP